MFISPFIRLTTLENSDAARLGVTEARRQAALLRVPRGEIAMPRDITRALREKRQPRQIKG